MKKVTFALVGLAALGVVATSTMGVVNAIGSTIGSSGIPIATFRQDRISAASKILNTSASNIIQSRKDKTLRTLIKNAGLTKKQFARKFRAQLVSELESQGYTKDQIIIALQYRIINHYLK